MAKKKSLSEQEKHEQRLKLQEKARQAQMKINERIRLDKEALSQKEDDEECEEEVEEALQTQLRQLKQLRLLKRWLKIRGRRKRVLDGLMNAKRLLMKIKR